MAVVCGPWRTDFHGGFRYRCCSGNASDEKPEPEADVTPALPPVREPPAVERVVITERTTKIARKLIESVFTEGATS